jgi:DNA polymerase/3'-5' exonuclease PolX
VHTGIPKQPLKNKWGVLAEKSIEEFKWNARKYLINPNEGLTEKKEEAILLNGTLNIKSHTVWK